MDVEGWSVVPKSRAVEGRKESQKKMGNEDLNAPRNFPITNQLSFGNLPGYYLSHWNQRAGVVWAGAFSDPGCLCECVDTPTFLLCSR